VLLGSASHYVSLERRKVACSRINPKLKSLAGEEFTDRKDHLFGLEKASKKLETEKTLHKVSDSGPSHERPCMSDDPKASTDLHCFLSRGTSAQYSGRHVWCLP